MPPVTGLQEGDFIPVPEITPIRTGYRFDGWSYTNWTNDPLLDGETIPGQDMTIYALWTQYNDREIRFTIGTETQTVRVKYNSLLPEGIIPTAESFGLEGDIAWDQEALERLEGRRITEDVTVTGVLTPKADGSEVSVAQADVTAGTVVQNDSDENLTFTVMAAYYDENEQMLRAAQEELVLPAKQTQIIPLEAPEDAASMKVMLLRTEDFVPLCPAAEDSLPAEP